MKNNSQIISAQSNFGDKRLDRRLGKIHSSLVSGLEKTIPQQNPLWKNTKGAYRFFDNDNVKPAGIIQSHVRTFESAFSEGRRNRYLQLSDTVEFDFTYKKGAADLGPLNYEFRKGIQSHNSMIINDLGSTVGLLQQTHTNRDAAGFGKSEERWKLPLEEKESYRWYQHFQTGQQMCKKYPHLEWIYVADREADFMELLTIPRVPNMHYIIRSQYNRNLANEDLKLWDYLAIQPIQSTYSIKVTDAKTKRKKKVKVNLRSAQVAIQLLNKTASGSKLPPVKLTAIEVKQVNYGKKNKSHVRWVLLTTLPVESVKGAKEIVTYYVWRWQIERYHYLLKSGGANIEDLQLHTKERLMNAISTYSIAAMDVMKLRYIAENQPGTPIYEIGITPLEHRVLFEYVHHRIDPKVKFRPSVVPTVEEFCILLGRIGGFFPSKRQPLPGLKILNRAASKFAGLVDFFSIFMSMN